MKKFLTIFCIFTVAIATNAAKSDKDCLNSVSEGIFGMNKIDPSTEKPTPGACEIDIKKFKCGVQINTLDVTFTDSKGRKITRTLSSYSEPYGKYDKLTTIGYHFSDKKKNEEIFIEYITDNGVWVQNPQHFSYTVVSKDNKKYIDDIACIQ